MAAKTLLLSVVAWMLAGPVLAVQEAEPAWAVAQAPDDACLVGAVRSLAELETALEGLSGEEAGSLGLVKGLEGKMPAGLFDVGGPVVAVLRIAEGKPELVLMLRLKDETKLEGERLDGDILEVKHSKPLFAKKAGPWAAFSEKVEVVKWFAAAPKRLALTDAEAAQVAGRTLWLRVEPKPLAVALKDLIEKQTRAAQGGAPVPAATSKVFDWLVGLAGQASGVVLAADVKPEGITADAEVSLADGSPLLDMARAGLPLQDLTGSLPVTDRPLLVSWGRIDWQKALPPYKALIRPLIDALVEGEDDALRKSVDQLWDAFEKWGKVLGTDVAILVEPAPPGQGMYRLEEIFTVEDPDAFRKLLSEQMAASKDMMSILMGKMPAMPGAPAMAMEVDYKEAAETIEGVPVDVMHMTVKTALPPNAPPEAKAQLEALSAAMYGPEGMVIRMAVVDKRAVVTMGDADGMARAIKVVRGQGPALSTDPKVAAALKRLPKDASGAGLLSLGNYTYMAMAFVHRMMAASMPAEVLDAAKAEGMDVWAPPPPGDLVTVSGRLEGRTVRIAVDVPQSEVRGAVAVGKEGGKRIAWYAQKQQEMMQKQNPGQGGKAAPPAEKKE